MGRERVLLHPACREHPSIRRELGMLRDIRAMGGQRDVRHRARQESAAPHSSPLIRTTLGQHKSFHVHLQHLFIIATNPQDITTSDTLQSFQELQTQEGCQQRQKREGFVVWAVDGGAGDLAQPRLCCTHTAPSGCDDAAPVSVQGHSLLGASACWLELKQFP